jgi:hypothetical protein
VNRTDSGRQAIAAGASAEIPVAVKRRGKKKMTGR